MVNMIVIEYTPKEYTCKVAKALHHICWQNLKCIYFNYTKCIQYRNPIYLSLKYPCNHWYIITDVVCIPVLYRADISMHY